MLYARCSALIGRGGGSAKLSTKSYTRAGTIKRLWGFDLERFCRMSENKEAPPCCFSRDCMAQVSSILFGDTMVPNIE